MVTIARKGLREVYEDKKLSNSCEVYCLSFRLCGSYEAMEGGFTTDALIDMTGGIEETFDLNTGPGTNNFQFKEQIKHVLWQAHLRESMIGCSITVIYNKTMINCSTFDY